MSMRVEAEIADIGINKLINANKTFLRGDTMNLLRSLRSKINDKVVDPTNAHIVLYIEDEKYDVAVGNGEQRYVFNIPDSDLENNTTASHQNESPISATTTKMKLNFSRGRIVTENIGSVPKTIAASTLGAAGGVIAYVALATNTATLPLAIAAAGGAAVNTCLAVGSDAKRKIEDPDQGTIEIEGSADEINKVLRGLKCNKLLKRDKS